MPRKWLAFSVFVVAQATWTPFRVYPQSDVPFNVLGPRIGHCGDDVPGTPCNTTMLAEICLATPACVAFNSNGFLKSCAGCEFDVSCCIYPEGQPYPGLDNVDLFVYQGNAPPPEWAAAIASADMLYAQSANPALCYMPEVGNGFLASVVNWNSLHMSGLFNGACGTVTKARLPSPIALTATNADPSLLQMALDLAGGVFVQRLHIPIANCTSCAMAQVEQRVFAHRTRRHVLVVSFSLVSLPLGVDAVTVALHTLFDPECSATPSLGTLRVFVSAKHGDLFTTATMCEACVDSYSLLFPSEGTVLLHPRNDTVPLYVYTQSNMSVGLNRVTTTVGYAPQGVGFARDKHPIGFVFTLAAPDRVPLTLLFSAPQMTHATCGSPTCVAYYSARHFTAVAAIGYVLDPAVHPVPPFTACSSAGDGCAGSFTHDFTIAQAPSPFNGTVLFNLTTTLADDLGQHYTVALLTHSVPAFIDLSVNQPNVTFLTVVASDIEGTDPFLVATSEFASASTASAGPQLTAEHNAAWCGCPHCLYAVIQNILYRSALHEYRLEVTGATERAWQVAQHVNSSAYCLCGLIVGNVIHTVGRGNSFVFLNS